MLAVQAQVSRMGAWMLGGLESVPFVGWALLLPLYRRDLTFQWARLLLNTHGFGVDAPDTGRRWGSGRRGWSLQPFQRMCSVTSTECASRAQRELLSERAGLDLLITVHLLAAHAKP